MKSIKISRLLGILFVSFSIIFSGNESKAVVHLMPYPNKVHIITLGDSFMTGYGMSDDYSFPEILGRRLRMAGYRNIQMLNMSEDQDTMLSAAQKVPQIVDFVPHVVIIQLGRNDVLQKRPLTQIYERLEFILQTLTEKKAQVLLVGMSPDMYPEEPYKTKIPEIFNYLVYKYKVAYYPNFMEGVEKRPIFLQSDGLHPNVRGTEMLAQNFKPIVEKMLDNIPKSAYQQK